METVSSWRATYVPGQWVVLAGPTSVVIMQPAPAHMSGLLSDLWQDVVSAADVADLAGKFSAFRLDLMPHFAAFFWAEDGMHSLIRGGLTALDAETGDVVAEGEGFHTWNEVGLQSVRQVRVEMDEPDDEPALALPLAVGVVLASSITIDSTQKVPLVLPMAEARYTVVNPATQEVYDPAEPVANEVEAVAEEPMEEPVVEAVPDEPSTEDEGPEDLAAEPSLPIETDDSDQQEPVEPSENENLDESEAPSEPSWSGHSEPQGDAWGVRSPDPLVPVDLAVDEDGDGIPDAQQSGLDLDNESAEALTEPIGFDVEEPEAPQPEGFPGFPGADVAQNQAGFLASPVPAPQGPPLGWNQPPQNPYGPPQPGQYGPPQGPAPTAMPFAAPGPQLPQPPSVPGQPFAGQAYPGQPYPGQPFPGQAAPGQYGQQQPSYPPLSPNGAPLASPVPPPAAYAPTAPPSQGPGAPSEPGLPVSAASADLGGTAFSTDIPMTHKPAAPRPGSDNLVLAAVCSFGHPNPPDSPRCRVCGQPVDNANPRLMDKPVLAELITAGGAHVKVTDTVLIGRAPSAQAGDGNPILLPVPSPNSDISRTHLRVAVKDWDIVATDLHSTNGTMLVRPGQAPVRMMPGTPVTVGPGTILDLGDGGVITVGMPA